MKLRCTDGVTRDFEPSKAVRDAVGPTGDYSASYCKSCCRSFGVHDTKIAKPRWRAHVCNPAAPIYS